ncbi:MAG TPA: hypothetical protein PLB62_11260, partial [Candidatus Sumerlaeota bacterium]|nr:hypothetical protein [Candidatus Sumerlaeota bacterium]
MKSMTIVFFCLLGILTFPSPAGQGPALIPLPREIQWGKGAVRLEGPVAVIGAESHPRTLNAIKEGLQKQGLEIVLSEAQGRATMILGREAAGNIRPGLAEKLSDLP